MRKVNYTWVKEFILFEPGDKVIAMYDVDPDKPWDYVYTVEHCIEPRVAGDTSIVFLEGVPKGWDSVYFKLAE